MDLSTSQPALDLTPIPARAVYIARPDGVLLYSNLADKAKLPALAAALGALTHLPDFAAGAKTHADEPQAVLLIWCSPAEIPVVAAALGGRDLDIWPGHLHAIGDWTPIVGMPHLTLIGCTPQSVPPWLAELWLGVAVPAQVAA